MLEYHQRFDFPLALPFAGFFLGRSSSESDSPVFFLESAFLRSAATIFSNTRKCFMKKRTFCSFSFQFIPVIP